DVPGFDRGPALLPLRAPAGHGAGLAGPEESRVRGLLATRYRPKLHTRTPSEPLVTMWLPSDAMATDHTSRVCPARARSSRPDSTSQSRTILSPPTETRSRPSGVNAACDTWLVWPVSVRNSRPLSRSQSLTVRSALADANRLPSGEKTTWETVPSWPESVRFPSARSPSQSLIDLSAP